MWLATSRRGDFFFGIRLSSSLGLFRASLFLSSRVLHGDAGRYILWGYFLMLPIDSEENFQEF